LKYYIEMVESPMSIKTRL